MAYLKVVGLLAAVTLFKATHATNACPVTETVFTGNGGVRYRICPDTDLVGKSQKVIANTASTTKCAQLCDQAMDCFKAVYDTQTRNCHFKGLGVLKWDVSARFDVIQAEQINIARCPYAETTYSNGGVSLTQRWLFHH
jgi:galactose oxidase